MQSVHASVDIAEYCPAEQRVHVVPPGEAKVSVTDPAVHKVHVSVETAENCPGSQSVQVLDPSPELYIQPVVAVQEEGSPLVKVHVGGSQDSSTGAV